MNSGTEEEYSLLENEELNKKNPKIEQVNQDDDSCKASDKTAKTKNNNLKLERRDQVSATADTTTEINNKKLKLGKEKEYLQHELMNEHLIIKEVNQDDGYKTAQMKSNNLKLERRDPVSATADATMEINNKKLKLGEEEEYLQHELKNEHLKIEEVNQDDGCKASNITAQTKNNNLKLERRDQVCVTVEINNKKLKLWKEEEYLQHENEQLMNEHSNIEASHDALDKTATMKNSNLKLEVSETPVATTEINNEKLKFIEEDRGLSVFETSSETVVKIEKDVSNKNPVEICPYCRKTFRDFQMEQHVSIHLIERPYKCDECEKAFKKPTHLQLHKIMHLPPGSFKCNQCDKSFTFPQALKRHRSIHGRFKRIKCMEEGCNYLADNQHLLERHFEKKHRPELSDLYLDGNPAEKKCYKCNSCPRRFSHLSSLQRHKKFAQCVSFECDQCDYKSPYPKTMEKHKKLHLLEKISQKIYCDECGFVTFSKRALGQHGIIHKRPSTCLQCPLCEKRVKRHAVLCKHILNMHEGIRSFTCESCGEGFMTEILLKQHYLDVHRKTDFGCLQCGKFFLNLHTLRKHERSSNCGKNEQSSSTVDESSENDFEQEDNLHQQQLVGHEIDVSDADGSNEDSDDD